MFRFLHFYRQFDFFQSFIVKIQFFIVCPLTDDKLRRNFITNKRIDDRKKRDQFVKLTKRCLKK